MVGRGGQEKKQVRVEGGIRAGVRKRTRQRPATWYIDPQVGTLGFKCKKTENAHSQFNELYEFGDVAVDEDIDDSVYLDQAALDKLEGTK